ncbi:hypothetical protein BaRGS_00003457 [Batillaria attramentaria]|uniref:Uncharacterized protein n=1 Tax=Batillaria attramentaria TaxID=370345 RepID=A0ABD0M081_9CAEN
MTPQDVRVCDSNEAKNPLTNGRPTQVKRPHYSQKADHSRWPCSFSKECSSLMSSSQANVTRVGERLVDTRLISSLMMRGDRRCHA